MPTTHIDLTDTEIACGVTPEQVAETRARALVRSTRVYVPSGTSPALAAAVARTALGQPAVFAGSNLLGDLVYREPYPSEREGDR
jgi:hypothetical protein